jgi:8-oxo-dGTP pyrophosphatase MutT (NUDIX family)
MAAMTRRTEYYDDPTAPEPNRLVPAVSAVIVDTDGRVLLHRRADNDLWALPGGGIEVGESVEQALVREVKEETGLFVTIDELIGIYSDPRYVVAYDDGEVRQQFSLCFTCRSSGGTLAPSDESPELRFVPLDELEALPLGPGTRVRLHDFRDRRGDWPVIA